MDSVIPQDFEKSEKKMLYLLLFGPELVCPYQGQLANHALAAHPFYVTVPALAGLPSLTRAFSPLSAFPATVLFHRFVSEPAVVCSIFTGTVAKGGKGETFRVVFTVGNSPAPCLLWDVLSTCLDEGGGVEWWAVVRVRLSVKCTVF